jgi:pyruvate dehydrogenase E1 component alpha subunit
VAAISGLTARAVAYARAGHGPFFIEARTSRWPGNYGSAPSLRPSGGPTDLAWAWAPEQAPPAVRGWVESSDPLLRHARHLLEAGSIDRAALQAMDAEVHGEMERALAFALASPEPEPAMALGAAAD